MAGRKVGTRQEALSLFSCHLPPRGGGEPIAQERAARGPGSRSGQPLQPGSDRGAAASEGPCRHTWLRSSGLHPAPDQLKTWPYGSKLLARKKRRSVLPGPKGTESHREVSVPWTWHPETHPKAARYRQHTAHNSLPTPPPCPLPASRVALAPCEAK